MTNDDKGKSNATKTRRHKRKKEYEVCFCHELSKRELKYQRQVDLPITYDGMIFDEGLRLDVLVEELIICELKAVTR